MKEQQEAKSTEHAALAAPSGREPAVRTEPGARLGRAGSAHHRCHTGTPLPPALSAGDGAAIACHGSGAAARNSKHLRLTASTSRQAGGKQRHGCCWRRWGESTASLCPLCWLLRLSVLKIASLVALSFPCSCLPYTRYVI